jgi:hypothetical protein
MRHETIASAPCKALRQWRHCSSTCVFHWPLMSLISAMRDELTEFPQRLHVIYAIMDSWIHAISICSSSPHGIGFSYKVNIHG